MCFLHNKQNKLNFCDGYHSALIKLAIMCELEVSNHKKYRYRFLSMPKGLYSNIGTVSNIGACAYVCDSTVVTSGIIFYSLVTNRLQNSRFVFFTGNPQPEIGVGGIRYRCFTRD